jgi:hypothetical protein
VPAAAVIPAPIAYIKVVAVKKLVVGFLVGTADPLLTKCVSMSDPAIFGNRFSGIHLLENRFPSFTVSKTECSKQA